MRAHYSWPKAKGTVAVLLLVAVGLAACAGGEGSPSTDDAAVGATDGATESGEVAAEDLEPIRFGYQASLWGAPLILAENLGMWEAAGLQVESQRFSAGKDVRDALLAGSVDAGSIGATPFIVAASTGQLVAVAAAGYLGETVWLVAKSDSGIESIDDLRGKNVAAAQASITELIFLTKVLPAYGMTEEDVTMRNVSFDGHVAALSTGEVDAFVGLEPYVSIAESQGVGKLIESFAEYDLLPNIFAFDKSFVEENEATAVAAVRSYMETTQLIEEDFDTAASSLHEDFTSGGLQIDKEALSTALRRVDVNPVLVDDFREYLNSQAEALMKEGSIDAIPDWDSVLRVDIQEKAMTDYWAEKAADS